MSLGQYAITVGFYDARQCAIKLDIQSRPFFKATVVE
jgi:hypothetical protein